MSKTKANNPGRTKITPLRLEEKYLRMLAELAAYHQEKRTDVVRMAIKHLHGIMQKNLKKDGNST